ncbi:5,6-dimethylbenzimidazole synthase [Acidisoma sp. C75]
MAGDETTPSPVFDAAFRGRLMALFRWRRDVRHFKPDPVAPALLARLLETACLAPSVGLSEPWRFVLVESAGCRAAIRANFTEANAAALAAQAEGQAALYARLKLAGLDEAPVHLAVFAESDPAQGHGLGRQTMPETTAYSAVMAVHTLWLAARAEGIGLGWVSILDPEAAARSLDVPRDWLFIGYFCLGFPAEESETPELARLGWERRQAQARPPLRR